MDNEYLALLASRLVKRQDLTVIDLDFLAEVLQPSQINDKFLPKEDLSKGTIKDQRNARFGLAENLWGKDRQFWLNQESQWLEAMRKKTGSSQDDGKDDFQDVISVTILTTIYTAVYSYHLFSVGKITQDELQNDLESANLIIKQAIFKGVLRSTTINGKNAYNLTRDRGMRAGGSGKYLPDPEVNLFTLLTFFLKDSINQDIYK